MQHNRHDLLEGFPPHVLGRGVVTVSQLVRLGLVSAADICDIRRVTERYPVRMSSHVAELIAPSDPAGPIYRQFVPVLEELHCGARGYSEDPLDETAHMPVAGLVHRYPDRALLHVSSVCAALCRFCFRKSLLNTRETTLQGENWRSAMGYLARAHSVKEVILSGGDPLVLPSGLLNNVMEDLSGLSHVRSIRVHTRVPLVSPDRITTSLINALSRGRELRIVVHVNHSAELVPESLASLKRLQRAGFPLLSQSVLLRGVNDQVAILGNLFQTLVQHKIRPYYLHHPDRARGTSHFAVSLSEGARLFRELRAAISQSLLPCYVVDLPGTGRKTPVESLVARDAYPEGPGAAFCSAGHSFV